MRTSVKIFQSNNDTLGNLCSGSLISKRHVITAAHCVSNYNSNKLIVDSLYVSPVYDNGALNYNFDSSYVSKVYFFKDWSLSGEDMAILELEKPIGESTGWISIGFDASDAQLLDGVFYKFSYPAATNLLIDPNEYNGDTLYYNYGLIDNLAEHRISIDNATGIGGESGSSIIKIKNGEKYITYGVLSLASNLSHSRINNWRYYAIKLIIEDDLSLKKQSLEDVIVYPNPANNIIHIKNIKNAEIMELTLYDDNGRACQIKNELTSRLELDISNLSNGLYLLHIRTPDETITKKIIKQGS